MRRSLVAVTIVSSSALVVMSCSSGDAEPTAGGDPMEAATDDGASGDQQDGPPEPEWESLRGLAVEPGTYAYANGPFPMTLTTEVVTYDPSRGGDPYRVVYGEQFGTLGFDFPIEFADVSQLVTSEEDASSVNQFGEMFAGPVDVPDDFGAWIAGAAALEVVDEGTLGLADGSASWWDVQVSEPAAKCFVDDDADSDPCVILWPYLEDQDDRQIGNWVSPTARVYAVPNGSDPVMAIATGLGTDDPDEVTAWMTTADQIVSSLSLG